MRSYRSSLLGDADDTIPTPEDNMPTTKDEAILPVSPSFTALADAAETAFAALRDRETERIAALEAFNVASLARDQAHAIAQEAKAAMVAFLDGMVP